MAVTRRLAAARVPVLRQQLRSRRIRASTAPAPAAARRSTSSACSAPASWARGSRRSPCSRERSSDSRTRTSRASGRGSPPCATVLQERLTRKQITRLQLDDCMSLVGGTSDYSGFGSADLVIEAVFEDLALKHGCLREVEPMLDDDGHLRVEHEHDSDRAHRRGVRRIRSACSGCTSSRPCTRCRCSR